MENKTNKKEKTGISKKIPQLYNRMIFEVLIMINLLLRIISQKLKITLKIQGNKERYIFGTDFNKKNYPKEAKINGDPDTLSINYYDFEKKDNTVELLWDNPIDDCQNMFKDCWDITEIDLSYFDTSKVTNMKYMFYGCSLLISLNLSNFNTSQVKEMNNMFSDCSLLISLNLSSFDTSKVQ